MLWFLNICVHGILGVFLMLGITSYIGPLYFHAFLECNYFYNSVAFLIICCILIALKTINPIYALLCILLSFILYSSMLFYIACEFIALIFLIIYVGALMILFLFIIMLFNLQNLRYNVRKTKTITYYTIMSFTVGLSFMLSTSTVKAIFLAGLSP